MNNYSESVILAVNVARSLAQEYRHAAFTPAHLLHALMHKEVGLRSFIQALGQDYEYILEWSAVRMEDISSRVYTGTDIHGDKVIADVFAEADSVRLKLGLDLLTPLCLLTALVKPMLAFSAEQLKSFPIKERDILSLYLKEMEVHQVVHTHSGTGATGKEVKGVLTKYAIDRLALVREGKLDPIIGRDKELRMMQEVLCRRTKPNVIICGEAGVGKTALVDGFAQAIVAGNVPVMLREAELFELDLGALVAGASYKGEVEDRLKQVISEIKAFDKAILFIDEVHTLLDSKGAIGSGVGNLLKPELARGEITVIGATTSEEYRKIIEPEQAFSRRFELLPISEPNEQAAIKMVDRLTPYYKEHHGLSIQRDAIVASVRLAKRYMKDKRLPDAAFDLLDKTMASMRMANDTSEHVLTELQETLDVLPTKLQALPPSELIEEYRWLYVIIQQKISPLLLGKLENNTPADNIESPAVYHAFLKRMLDQLSIFAASKGQDVNAQDVTAIVAHSTGIPIGKIQAQEQEKLLHMREYLAKRVIGQAHAIKAVTDAVLESRSGLNKLGQPIGSFFLLGPTGTGKTELAKSIAEFLFDDENAMIRFDMSEFKEEHSAALLYGAPPGYVGYEEGGLLVNKIRKQPYSVLLFDEIEKAHPSVFDTFLQILDEGHMHDRLGKRGDFSNALILFTSNLGSDLIVQQVARGQMPVTAELIELMTAYFRPEFLARLSEIVPFAPIDESNVVDIFNIQIKQLEQALKRQHIELSISNEAKRMLALSGFSPKYGARQLNTVIRNQLRRPISRMLVAGELTAGNTVVIDKSSTDESLVWTINE